jgi:hypothetical protein
VNTSASRSALRGANSRRLRRLRCLLGGCTALDTFSDDRPREHFEPNLRQPIPNRHEELVAAPVAADHAQQYQPPDPRVFRPAEGERIAMMATRAMHQNGQSDWPGIGNSLIGRGISVLDKSCIRRLNAYPSLIWDIGENRYEERRRRRTTRPISPIGHPDCALRKPLRRCASGAIDRSSAYDLWLLGRNSA